MQQQSMPPVNGSHCSSYLAGNRRYSAAPALAPPRARVPPRARTKHVYTAPQKERERERRRRVSGNIPLLTPTNTQERACRRRRRRRVSVCRDEREKPVVRW